MSIVLDFYDFTTSHGQRTLANLRELLADRFGPILFSRQDQRNPEFRASMLLDESVYRFEERRKGNIFESEDDDFVADIEIEKWLNEYKTTEKVNLVVKVFVKMFKEFREEEPSEKLKGAVRLLVKATLQIGIYTAMWDEVSESGSLEDCTAISRDTADTLCDAVEDLIVALAKHQGRAKIVERAVRETLHKMVLLVTEVQARFEPSVVQNIFTSAVELVTSAQQKQNDDDDDGDSSTSNDTETSPSDADAADIISEPTD